VKVLITGATGFLGKHLVKKVERLGWDISISNSKIANLKNIENLYRYNDIRFDLIFHLAAVTKAGDYCLKHPGDQWLANQAINTNILEYWKTNQPHAKMICMGTSCSYSPDLEMVEENYLLGKPEKSLYTYAMTKRMLLAGLHAIEKQYGLKWLYFVPSTLYGPNFELDDNHFIFDFIRNCYNAKNYNNEFVVWGDGEQRRELVYVDDAVDIMLNLLDKENEIYNIGTGQDNSINDFASMVAENFNFDQTLIGHDLTKYVGVKEKKINIQKTLAALNKDFLFKFSLDTGIKNSVKYFIEETKKQNE